MFMSWLNTRFPYASERFQIQRHIWGWLLRIGVLSGLAEFCRVVIGRRKRFDGCRFALYYKLGPIHEKITLKLVYLRTSSFPDLKCLLQTFSEWCVVEPYKNTIRFDIIS